MGYAASSINERKEGKLNTQGNIFPLQNMDLLCNDDKIVGSITWTKDGKALTNSQKYIIHNNSLTVKNMEPSDSGQYACNSNVDSVPYVVWQDIKVQPYPDIQVSNYTLKCEDMTFNFKCCADSSYSIQWSDSSLCGGSIQAMRCITCNYAVITQKCLSTDYKDQFYCQLSNKDLSGFQYSSKAVQMITTRTTYACTDNSFGLGKVGESKTISCPVNMTGYIIGTCQEGGKWTNVSYCVLSVIQDLKIRAQNLAPVELPQFVANLSSVALNNPSAITNSPFTVLTIVDLVTEIANVSQSLIINQTIMTNFLSTLDVIASQGAKSTWTTLNSNSTNKRASSDLLKSIESFASRLSNNTFDINSSSIQLQKSNFTQSFIGTFGINLTTHIDIPYTSGLTFITTIVLTTFDNVLPVRSATINDSVPTNVVINGAVTAVIVNDTVNSTVSSGIQNISLIFDENQTTLSNPQCVFWNFNLLDGIGGWDSTGCEVSPLNQADKVGCTCNHTTSFSILMSPYINVENLVLTFITYIGVGISMVSLVLCLIIEGIIWKPMTRNETSYMRHVSIINIALSLLIADICFIIAANIVNYGEPTPVGPCSAATFFMHFFYLALFFWMLFSALLLFYRTIMVFSGVSKCTMMIIAFTLGYGAPLLIAVITVAVTAGGGGYVPKQNACWLNWDQTKALLAFVIPALTIVAINFLIMIVVLYKMLRRGIGATTQPDETHAILVIARCVAILTPLFGLTWGFGIGTLVSPALGIQIVFALFNSLQGFFILLFGTLLDSKIREALAGRLRLVNISSNRTRSTSTGPSSSSGLTFLQRFRRRNVYHMSDGSGFTAASSNSDTFANA
ncbi:adhesion G protein-coupled receptor F4-like isoform X2 [Hoplias malabaricus]